MSCASMTLSAPALHDLYAHSTTQARLPPEKRKQLPSEIRLRGG